MTGEMDKRRFVRMLLPLARHAAGLAAVHAPGAERYGNPTDNPLMPYEETSGSVDRHPPADIPFPCLRLAQGAAALVLFCDVLAWVSAAAIWPLLASLGLCLIIAIAGLATFFLIQRARRGDGIAFHRRLLGFYAATGMSLILLVLRGSAVSLAGPVISFVLSLFAFVLLLWAGVESGGAIENGSAARDQQNVEPPKSVY